MQHEYTGLQKTITENDAGSYRSVSHRYHDFLLASMGTKAYLVAEGGLLVPCREGGLLWRAGSIST